MTRSLSSAVRHATWRVAILLGATTTVLPSQTFSFDGTPPGPVPFTITSGGLHASFSAPVGGFELFDTTLFPSGMFSTLSGGVIGSVDADVIIEPLTITFDQALATFSVRFALNDMLGGTWLTADVYLGAVPVGTFAASGGLGGGALPEGSLSFAASAFDRVVLSSDAVDFFVDEVQVTTTSPVTVSEPDVTLVLLMALAVLLHGRAKRSPANW